MEAVAAWNRGRDEGEKESRMGGFGDGVRVDGVIVIIAGGADGGAAVDAGRGNGVVKDADDGIGVVGGGDGEIARELGPVSSTDGACHATMADIGCDAHEVKGMHALGCEDCLNIALIAIAATTTTSTTTAERLEAYCTYTLQSEDEASFSSAGLMKLGVQTTSGQRNSCLIPCHQRSNGETQGGREPAF